MAKFVFIRHTLTDYNLVGSKGVFCGVSDPPLNNNGIIEAQELSELLNSFHYDDVYSSDLKRAYQTAEIVVTKKEFIIKRTEKLNEISYGAWEGLSKNQIMDQFPNEFDKFNYDPITHYPPNGEDPNACLNRIIDWIKVNRSNDIKILVFTHKTILRLLFCNILNIPLSNYRDMFDIKIGSISVLDFNKGKYRIEAINYGAKIKRII